MRNYISIFLLLFFVDNIHAQVNNNTQNTTATDNFIPNIIPPTPTVASLMKFEEIPVSKYSGIPDVSIPLYSINNVGLNINISMKYHPLSIKRDEIAGYTGLGWSLFAGGTISRTVRDIPDEYFSQATASSNKKIGIYDFRNNYYDVLPLLSDTYSIDYNNQEINEFFYEASEKQKYDSKQDLYQYNFMGYSGKFIIEKVGSNYNVVKLSKDNLKITYNHVEKTFDIVDDKGIKYVFDVKEQSESYSFNENITFTGDSNLSDSYNYNYISSFHLSKVIFENNLLAEFIYNAEDELFIEKQRTVNNIQNLSEYLETYMIVFNGGSCQFLPSNILPSYSNQATTVETKTKKLKQIKIPNQSIIDFTTLKGNRQDYNILSNTNTPYLNKISIKDWNNKEVKSYQFEYAFSSKLFLANIIESTETNETSKYSFSYKNNTIPTTGFKTDYWGYYKALGSYCDNIMIDNYLSENRNVDKEYVSKDVLNQIIYPTKGATIFEYEPNTYSYVGNTEVASSNPLDGSIDYFENNPDNWIINQINDLSLNSSYGNEQLQTLGFIGTDKTYIFNSSIDNNEGIAGFLNLYKKTADNQTIETTSLISECPLEIRLQTGFKYSIGFRWNHMGQVGENPLPSVPINGHANVVINEKTIKSNLNQYLYGGGIRIKNIYYLDKTNASVQAELQNQGYPSTFEKKISFDYNFFDNSLRSSGSLVYPKPIVSYEITRKIKHNGTCTLDYYLWSSKYRVNTNLNNLSAISTQGGDVGYKNVTVSETNHGKSEYTYTSPIEYPESLGYTAIKYPFAPTKNIDYKRGLLVSEKKFDNTSRLLTSTENAYDFENFEKITGITLYYSNEDCPTASSYLDYQNYKIAMESPTCGNSVQCGNARLCGIPTNFISYYLNKEAFGWAKMKQSTSKNYFYTGNNLAKTTVSENLYTYSSNNMQLLKQGAITPDGTINETSYQYAHEKANQRLINANMISTPLETEVKKNSKTIAKSETKYDNLSNLLPSSVLSYDLQNGTTPSTEVTYDKYDSKGNLQQYTTKNGIPVSIIWGYNNTQPIAKIEGTTYDQASALTGIGDIIAKSDEDINESTQNTLISTLDDFRKNNNRFYITTYSYDPLIGVTSITPPSGIREVYTYDTANRLKEIKQELKNANGSLEYKILKEFKYNYKN